MLKHRTARTKQHRDASGFIYKKALGQNFLVDQKVLQRIADACDLKEDETILEIGPGQGALTRVLFSQVKHIVAVEADGQLVERLKTDFDPEKLTVHHADFLKFDLSRLPTPIKAVGNLPYYISTPIITRVIEHRALFTSLFMTVQLEFGERLLARPCSKDYGSLSVFVQFYTEPKALFKIGNHSFRPTPKVNSTFMRLDLRPQPLAEVADIDLFERVVRQAFLQRRKTLTNSLSAFRTKEVLADVFDQAGISPRARAEELGGEDYARLTNALTLIPNRS